MQCCNLNKRHIVVFLEETNWKEDFSLHRFFGWRKIHSHISCEQFSKYVNWQKQMIANYKQEHRKIHTYLDQKF